MSRITTGIFERAVARFFEPIAREHGWPLIHRGVDENGEDAFEIVSPHYILRIRFNVGMHGNSMDVVFELADETRGAKSGGKCGFGLLAVAGYNGVNLDILPQEDTEDGLMKYADYLAGQTKRFGLPYLLGQKTDADAVREYWRMESEKELEKIKGYRFPPSVQKRWHLPPPPSDEKD